MYLTKAADDINEQFWKAFKMVHLADFWLSAKITIKMYHKKVLYSYNLYKLYSYNLYKSE